MSANKVTGTLTQTFPAYQLYNSEVYKRSAGIWRYAGGGVIHADYYDYDKESIGPYKFNCPYGYVLDFYITKSTPPTYLLFKALLNTDTALAAFFVNNSFVCLLFEDCLKFIDLDDNSTAISQLEPGIIIPKKLLNVGWVKTYTMCACVPALPYKLQMDISNYQLYLGNGNWVPLPKGTFPKTMITPEYPLYQKLLDNPDSIASFTDSITGKDILIKEVIC